MIIRGSDPKIDPNIWPIIKERFGFTDEELDLFKSLPTNHKMLTDKAMTRIVTTNVVFEVVESRACNTDHEVGEKIYFNLERGMLAHKGPKYICPFLMPVMTRTTHIVQDRIWEGLDDPLQSVVSRGGCDDIGVECGGVGKVILEVKVTCDGI